MSRKLILAAFIIPLCILSAVSIQSAYPGEIGGLHYVYWNFPLNKFTSLYVDIGILSEPDNNDGLYFQMYQGTINGEGFYFGLQTQTYKPGYGSMGKGLIFSRWGTKDLSNVRIVEGGWAQSAGYEGDFVGIRKTYSWTTHNYRLKIALNDTDSVGDWYGVWITDLHEGTTDLLGSIRFPKVSPNESGIADGGITWTELYWKAQPGTPIPTWHVSIINIYASEQQVAPLKAVSAYSEIDHTDIYCDETKTIHFLMGLDVNRTHPPGVLFDCSGECNVALIARGLDNSIYYKIYSSGNSWGSWKRLPGATCDSPASAVYQNELHFVVRGMDGSSLWHGYLSNPSDPGSFSGWTLLSGATHSAPTLTSNGTMLYLVVRGLNNRIYHRCYNEGSWGSWVKVPTGATCDSLAAAMLGKELHIVVRGFSTVDVNVNNTMWHIIIQPGGGVVRSWVRLSGATPSKPVLAANQTINRLYLVVRGMDNRIYWRTYDGLPTDSWGSWSLVPTGSTCDGPGATIADNKLHFVVRGMDGSTLWHRYYYFSAATYSDWTRLSGSTPSSPTLAQAEEAFKLYGLDFSPFTEDGQDPNQGCWISEEQLREKMEIVGPYTEWIRTFGCTHGLEKAGLIARSLNLKIAVGAWLGIGLSANEEEISSLISIAQAGQADMLIVGSEVLLRHDLAESQLIAYINRVREAVPGIPVATADVYGELLEHPAVVNACDVVLPNYYPFWEGIDVKYAMYYLNLRHQQVVEAANGKPVIVSEAGWPSGGNQVGDAIPSPENACFFFMNFVSWARAENVSYFYFEAFDEPWKASYEGPQGAHWGIWFSNSTLKPGMQDVFDGKTIPDNWSGKIVVGGEGDPTIEFTYVPPYGSFENLRGQVWHVKPAEHKVAVYIYVGSGWWTKPYWDNPLTTIMPDGSWVCDITTGGNDRYATKITAFLVPAGYDPPLMKGESTLPQELDEQASAKVEVTRLIP